MTWLEQMRPVEVLPSLYAADFARLGEQMRSLLAAGVFGVGDIASAYSRLVTSITATTPAAGGTR